MLLPRITRPRCCSRYLLRCSSSIQTKQSYSSKVRAYPFAFSLEEALVQHGPTISVNAGGKDILQSLGARFLPGFGIKPIQPKQAKAVYLPAWIIDAEVEAKFWIRTAEDQEAGQHALTACFQDSFMPGFVLSPLSRVSLKSSALVNRTTVQWTPELERQFEQDIMCLPFTSTPFSLPSLARSASFKDAVISDDFRFDPTSVKDHFIAAYPVLIPVYLLHFPVEVGSDYSDDLTVVIEAYQRDGNYTMSNIMVDLYKEVAPMLPFDTLKRNLAAVEKLEFFRYGPGVHGIMRAADIRSLHTLPAAGRPSRHRSLERWIDRSFTQKGKIEAYQKFWQSENPSGKIDWEDLRIREFVPEEVNAVRSYMDMGIVEANLREMDKTIGGIKGLFSSSSTVSKESNQPNTSSDTDMKSPTTGAKSDESTTPPEGLKAKDEKKEVPSFQFKMQHGEVFKAMFLRDGSDALGELVKQRQSRKPSWMTEWEEQSRLRQAKRESDVSQKSQS